MVRDGGQPAPTFFGAYAQWAATPPPAWEDVAWLRQLWGGPFLVKGITRVDDAKRAVDTGATAVSVSNHGGNDLDGTPATIRVLPAVAAAVGGQVEVLLDGGIRRGGDVVKAVALGARAVMIGRAYLWGWPPTVRGVENVLDILRGGIDSRCSASARPASATWPPTTSWSRSGSPVPSAATAPSSTRHSTSRPSRAGTLLTVREEPCYGARCGAGRRAVEAGLGLGQRRRAEGASRPRARARSTASPRRCVPSFA